MRNKYIPKADLEGRWKQHQDTLKRVDRRITGYKEKPTVHRPYDGESKPSIQEMDSQLTDFILGLSEKSVETPVSETAEKICSDDQKGGTHE